MRILSAGKPPPDLANQRDLNGQGGLASSDPITMRMENEKMILVPSDEKSQAPQPRELAPHLIKLTSPFPNIFHRDALIVAVARRCVLFPVV